MQLSISHSTTYRYSEPVHFGRHRLVLRPREGHDLRVESMEVSVSVAHDLAWTRDVFGNSVALLDMLEPTAELKIVSDVRVTRAAPFPRRSAKSHWPVPYPVIYDSLEAQVAAAYQATSYPDDLPSVRAFLEREELLSPRQDEGIEELLDRLNERLKSQINYGRRPERGTQSPGITLERQSGSCRDIATLMMESCRVMGIAARFASGYLDCLASTAGNASTHAWLEAYLPPAGWVAFDPTIGERCSHKHIVCGLSNHPRGVMPVSGTYSPTETSEYLGMTVGVQIVKEEGGRQ